MPREVREGEEICGEGERQNKWRGVFDQLDEDGGQRGDDGNDGPFVGDGEEELFQALKPITPLQV